MALGTIKRQAKRLPFSVPLLIFVDTNHRSPMKRIMLTALCLFCFFPLAFAQSTNALFLKDGSKVTGYVQAMDPAADVTIRTNDGKMLTFPMKEVDNIIWSYREKEPGPGPIYRYGDVFRWKYNDMELSDRNFERYFDDDLYHTYITARNQFNLGGAGLTLGIGCILLSAIYFDYDSGTGKQSDTFHAYIYSANILICLGSIFTGIGISRLNWVERTFNARQENYDTSRVINSMKLNPSIMLTSSNDLALGASLTLSF